MNNEEYRKKIELEILQIIKEKLEARQMDAQRVKEIAQYLLHALHPHMDIDQIYSVVKDFDKHFPELVPVVIQVTKDYDERIKNVVSEHVSILLKQGKVSEANTLLKKALNREVKLQ